MDIRKRGIPVLPLLLVALATMGTDSCDDSQESKDREIVDKQQAQYAKGQPIPFFSWSLERDLVIKLYNIRNQKVATHSVWRSDYGMVEGDCPSMGYGIPYDTSLTNPWMAVGYHQSQTSIGQAEPNGLFASANTVATWVMCVGDTGLIEPQYVESKVTVYPGPVSVDYEKNRVTRVGKATVTMSKK